MHTKYYAHGDWNAICWRCGFKYKASQLRREWEGFYVCDKCWERRHPQDFVRGVQDIVTPPWVQRPTDTFVTSDFITTTNSGNAYTYTLSVASQYDYIVNSTVPYSISLTANFTNTGAATLTLVGSGNTGALPWLDSSGSALTAGAIVSGKSYGVLFNKAANNFTMEP